MSVNLTRDLFLYSLLPLFESKRALTNYGSPFGKGPKTTGRCPLVKTADLLGLSLWYLKTKSAIYQLCPIFGITPTGISVWLNYILEVLYQVVTDSNCEDFDIRWPTDEEQLESASLLESNRVHGRLLRGVFAIMDGGKMPCSEYLDTDLQNAFFEGYTEQVEVTILFVWNFRGELIHAAINFPGSWHDTELAAVSELYHPKLSDEYTRPGMAVLADSAFVITSRVTNGKIIRPRKSNEVQDIPKSTYLAAVDTILQAAIPSEKQSAEWGVRVVKGAFPRLNVQLSVDVGKRRRVISICCHMFNSPYSSRGLNQIRTTYAQKQTPN